MPISRRELHRLLAFGFGSTLLAACERERNQRPPRPTNVSRIQQPSTQPSTSIPTASAIPTQRPTQPPTAVATRGATQRPPTASAVPTTIASSTSVPVPTATELTRATAIAPTTQAQALRALGFDAFADVVTTYQDETYLYIESTGLPRHQMMVGIRNWQQQLPLAQPYRGTNAWKVPLHPHPAVNPISAQRALYRGAIAIAINGVPIFNALNNRGDDAYLAGELDNWGGHSGKADDYHYHIAPLHLQAFIGADQPIAYALDGYAIYGLLEPNGSEPVGLDAFNGHLGPDGVYHYHASTTYPYINGGMYGEVTVQDDQIEPQPHLVPFRQPQVPLRGAVITDFIRHDATHNTLVYTLNGQTYSIDYEQTTSALNLQFHDATGDHNESYTIRNDTPNIANSDAPPPAPRPTNTTNQPVSSNGFIVRSPVIQSDMALPPQYTCDGDGMSPPLEWANIPDGTQSLALVMHHIAGAGDVHWYWIVYNIPPTITSIAANDRSIGTYGTNSVNPNRTYAPPCSKGPGRKEYIISLYALRAALEFDASQAVNRDMLLSAVTDRTLAVATMTLNYTR
jgi:phosphatidylethanolamine-binding protein (PEBP) family uncharacterized protein